MIIFYYCDEIDFVYFPLLRQIIQIPWTQRKFSQVLLFGFICCSSSSSSNSSRGGGSATSGSGSGGGGGGGGGSSSSSSNRTTTPQWQEQLPSH